MGYGRLREAVAHGGSTECQSTDRKFYEVNVKLMLCHTSKVFQFNCCP